MNTWKALVQRWRKSSITTKFTTAFSLLLALIVLVSITSHAALKLVYRETESAILTGTEIQGLVLEMDRDLQEARVLQGDFFLHYPTIGYAEARQIYALAAVEKMAGVVALSTDLQQRIAVSDVSAALQERNVDLNLYLSAAERFSDTFLAAVELAARLAAAETGLEAQLAQNSALLLDVLQSGDDSLLDLHRDITAFEKDYLLTRQRPFMQSALNVAARLRQDIEDTPTLADEPKAQALVYLDNYQSNAQDIIELNVVIRSKLNDFELQAQRVNPISVELISLAKGEVERAQGRIDQVNRVATTILISTALGGLLLVILVARALNHSITLNIVKLTETSGEWQAGNLDVSAQIDSSDEVGQLADSFNDMAARINSLVGNLEQKVRERTRRLETVATLSGNLTAILDFDELLLELVNQVKERFDYYQVQVYLLDTARESLVLAQGYGKAGAETKQRGMQIDLATTRSLVARAAREQRVVLITDVRQEPGWLPNPLLPDTRSEIAVPIVAEEQVMGILDVQADEVDGLDDADSDLLRSLANQVGVALTNARFFEQIIQANTEISILNERLKDENLRMMAELDVTRQLQQMLLPTDEELRQVEGLDIAGFMEPAEEVGGDYYDVLQYNGRVKIGIGDVTGHGLESGVVMLMIQTAVRTLLTSDERDPVRFMDVLNRTLHANMRRMGVDKSLSLSLLDYQTGRLRLSGQHEQLIVVRQGGQVELVDTLLLGLPVGLVTGIADFVGEMSIELEPGDGVVLYSDGFTEAQNEAGEFYGLEQLCRVVSRHWAGSAEEIKEEVVRDALGFIGEQTVYDDLTLLVVKQQ